MYKYKAFISYRHISFDSAVAQRVMRLIETFTPPRSIHINEKFEKWRCFRDEEELPLSKNLGDDIHDALRNSEFLVIICSPEYNESQWCLEELRYFKEIHKGSTNNIVVISISGDPAKTLPKDVLSSIEDGEIRNVEPLSADIRAANEEQSLKKLNTLYLKMVARFLDCEYNDLVHRHEKRKRKHTIIISSIIIFVLLAFTIVLAFSYSRIQKNNNEIESQNYTLRIENAKHLALESEILWNESKPLDAIKTVLQAVPSDDNPIPLLPDVSLNLTNQIGAFKPTNFQPVKTVSLYNCPNTILFSSNGQTMITEDGSYISFWNSDTGELIQQYYVRDLNGSIGSVELYQYPKNTTAELSSTGRGAGVALSSGQWMYDNYTISESLAQDRCPIYYYHSNGELYCFDEANGDILWKLENVCQTPAYGTGRIALLVGSLRTRPETVLICDAMTGEAIETYSTEPLLSYESCTLGYYDVETRTILFNIIKDETAYIVSSRLQSGKIIIGEEFDSLPNVGLRGCTVSGEIAYTVSIDFSNGIDTSSVDYIISAFDLNDGHCIWKREITDVIDGNYQLGVFSSELLQTDSDYIYFSNHDKLTIIRSDTGETLHQFIFSSKIVDLYIEQNGVLIITTANGEEIAVPVNEFCSSDNETAYCAILHRYLTEVSCCSRLEGYYAVATHDNMVYLYHDVINCDYTELLLPDQEQEELYFYIYDIEVAKQRVIYGMQYQKVDNWDYKMLSLETGEIIDLPDDTISECSTELPEWFPDDEFSGLYANAVIMLNDTDAAVIINDSVIRIYDYETGNIIRQFEINYNEIIKSGFSVNNGESILLVGSEGSMYRISSQNGQLEASNKIAIPDGSYCDEIQYIDEQIIVIYKRNHKKYAWILNLQDLSAKYYIEDFEFYDEENGLIYLFEPYSSRLGTIPVYTTDELIKKAEKYLSGEY